MVKVLNKINVHVIGGTGQMGTWLKNFLESQSLTVSVSGRGGVKGDVLKKSDIVFISVPLDVAPKVIAETAIMVNKNCTLIDLSSLQSQSSRALQKSKLSSAAVHFLFSPIFSSIQNQKIIIYRIKDNKSINDLVQIFKDAGGQIIEMSAKKHDKYMAYVQALTHFINLSFAKTLIEDGVGLGNTISTPVFLAQLFALNRVVIQEPEMLTKIQLENPFYKNILKKYLKNQQQLISLITKGDSKKLQKAINLIHQKLELVPKNTERQKEGPSFKGKFRGKLKISYLGPEGTFSQQALLSVTTKDQPLIPCKSINDIFESIKNGLVDYGLVPAENSTEGTIRETLDYLVDYDLKVNLSLDLIVHQNLLSKEYDLKDITTVFSHPQGIAQSRYWLNIYLPKVKIQTAASTISAVTETEKRGVAIIGASVAAKMYGLNILAKNIESTKHNITKFYLISKVAKKLNPKATRTLLFLTVFNRVGVLRDILNVFADNNINLTKIESRPSREKIWDYHFFIEVEATQDQEKLTQALNVLKQHCPVIKVFGEI